jgi:hypothetical protein
VSESEDVAETACDTTDTDCSEAELIQRCTVAPGCFAELAGAIVGVAAAPADTVTRTTRLPRPSRQRGRTTGTDKETKGNPGVSE